MVSLQELARYLDDYLEVPQFRDYCPNGLQVEGRGEVRRIVCGVTASQALIEAAIAVDADALLVHHGFFWRGEAAPVTGIKKRRLGALLGADISLLAYHLPLDAHPLLGNNVQLAERLQLVVEGRFGPDSPAIGLYGRLGQPQSASEFAARIGRVLGRVPLHIGDPERPLTTLAWCSGAAQSYLEEAIRLGVEGFLTGEVSEQTVHLARETGVQFFSAGHHATERYGVQALGEHLARHFGIAQQFIDIDNPV